MPCCGRLQVHTCDKAVRLGVAALSPQAPAFRSGPHCNMTFTAEGVARSIQQVGVDTLSSMAGCLDEACQWLTSYYDVLVGHATSARQAIGVLGVREALS